MPDEETVARRFWVIQMARLSAFVMVFIGALIVSKIIDLPDFVGVNTTTEFMAHEIHRRLVAAIRAGDLGPHAAGLAGLRVVLRESPRAWGAFEGPV